MANEPAKSPTANRLNNFGSYAQSPNHQTIAESNYPYYEDATGTPNQSPLAITTTPIALLVPNGAVKLIITGSVAFRVSDQAALNTTKPYYVQPASTPLEIPCVTPNTDPLDTSGTIWIAADSTSGTVNFFFECV